jgi:hypothetical protein
MIPPTQNPAPTIGVVDDAPPDVAGENLDDVPFQPGNVDQAAARYETYMIPTAQHPVAGAAAEDVVADYWRANAFSNPSTGYPMMPGGPDSGQFFTLGVRISASSVVLISAVDEGLTDWETRLDVSRPESPSALELHMNSWKSSRPIHIRGYKVLLKPNTCNAFTLGRIYSETEIIALVRENARFGCIWCVP